jgi:hypothetical protein
MTEGFLMVKYIQNNSLTVQVVCAVSFGFSATVFGSKTVAFIVWWIEKM